MFCFSFNIFKYEFNNSFFVIRVSKDAIVKNTYNLWKKWCYMDLHWLTLFNWQLFWALNWLCFVTVSYYLNSFVTFQNMFYKWFCKFSVCWRFVKDHIFNAVVSITIAYSWKDCGPSLVWSSRSYSKMHFNLVFAVCRRLPSGLQMVKVTGEREYSCECLKSKGFLVFKL